MELFKFTNWKRNIFRAKLFSHSDSVRGCSEGGRNRAVTWTRGKTNAWDNKGIHVCCMWTSAHLNLSAGRPPFHTPGEMIALISINRRNVQKGHECEREAEESQMKCLSGCVWDSSWNKVLNNCCLTVCADMPDDARPDTYHVERHDDHKVDADTRSRCGELPVLLHIIQFEGSKLFHCNQTENHHSKHSRQDEGNLRGGKEEGVIHVFKNWDKHS